MNSLKFKKVENKTRNFYRSSTLTTKKNQERKAKNEERDKRDKKGTGIDHMTERKRRQNLAKCCSVSLQSGMNQ